MERVDPHLFRHTFAHHWMLAGEGEVDLMTNMGWDSPEMLRRYGSSARGVRAKAAHKRLGLGDRY